MSNNKIYSLSWFERFGNNIQQISNLILYSLHYNVPAISPNHKYIHSFKINEHLITNNHIIRYNKFFNCWNFNGCGLWSKFTQQRHEIIKEKIYPQLKFKNQDISILNDNELVIHIRSGDIFKPSSHGFAGRQKFVQNPLSFFTKIMEPYNKIYICSAYGFSSRINPVIKKLANDPRVTVFLNRNLIDDILLILSSKNVCVGGVGTFGLACCMLSQNLKNFYSTDLDPQTFLNFHNINEKITNKTIIPIDQSKYIKVGHWKNTNHQRQLMLEYEL